MFLLNPKPKPIHIATISQLWVRLALLEEDPAMFLHVYNVNLPQRFPQRDL